MTLEKNAEHPSTGVPSFRRALLVGALGFSAVSFCVFATVAYGERWMYTNLNVLGAYIVWTALFILLGGTLFGSLVVGRWRLPKFYLLFGLAFLAYAVGWTSAYFTFPSLLGEWAGSLAGSILMALVFATGFRTLRSTLKLSLILFASNSIGYFLGSALNDYVAGRTGMLLWGVMYGLFLGAGIGLVLHLAQKQSPISTTPIGVR